MSNLKVNQDDPRRLKSLIYGCDGTNTLPLRTDATGSLATIYTRQFINFEEHFSTAGNSVCFYSTTRDISTYAVYTYFVTSLGGATQFIIQISPDGITFIDDGLPIIVADGQAAVLVSNNFLRYLRLRITDSGTATTGVIFLQAQG